MAKQRKRSGGRVTPSPNRPSAGTQGSAARAPARARVPAKRGGPASATAGGKGSGTGSGKGSSTGSGTKAAGRDTAAGGGRQDRASPEDADLDEGGPPERPFWGMGDMAAWFFAALAAELVVQIVVVQVLVSRGYLPFWPDDLGAASGEVAARVGLGQSPEVSQGLNSLPLGVTVLLQLPLWACLFGGPFWVARKKGTSVREDFGFSMRAMDVPLGIAVGVASQLLLIPAIFWVLFKAIGDQSAEVSEPVVRLTSQVTSPLSAILLVLIVGIGAPLAEELFFRGLSQRAIAKRFGPLVGLVGASLFFAVSHFQLVQLPGLFAFGLVLGYMAQRFGRLGPAIWAHLAFNLTAVIAVIGNLRLP